MRSATLAARPLARNIRRSAPANGLSAITQLYKLTAHCLVSASASPFNEPTSPNPNVTRHAQTVESLHDYGSYLMQSLPKFIQQFSVLNDELTLYICPSGVVPVLTFLRDHSQCQYKSVVDISGVDFPERDKRFEIVYHMLSYKYASRIRVKTYSGEADSVPSATSVFRGADWCVVYSSLVISDIDGSPGMSEKHGIYMGFSSRTTRTCM